MNFGQKKAFTPVEIIIYIQVIIVLVIVSALFTILSTNDVIKVAQARDNIRINDINNLEQALILYSKTHKNFPMDVCNDTSLGSDNCGCGTCNEGIAACHGNDWCHQSYIWQELVGSGLVKSLPRDPINDKIYYYWYEPCCEQDCGGGRTCVNQGCCEYHLGASSLELTGGVYSRWGRYEIK